MSLSSSSSSRSPTPVITTSSTNVSTNSSTGSQDDSSVDNVAAAGRFDLGLTKTMQATDTSANNAASVVSADPASAAATTDDAPADQAQSAHSPSPPLPQPVRVLIRSLACVVVGGGLFSTIYGGLKLMPPFDPVLEQQRGAHIGVMVSGVVELVIGLVVGMQTLIDPRCANSPSHPA